MTTVAVRERYTEILSVFGDVQSAVDLALQRYTIEQITTRVAELRRRDAEYRAQYGVDYPTFAQRAAEDEAFVHQIERRVSKIWEIDLADWEYCYKGAEDWTRRLQTITSTSTTRLT